MDILLIDDEPVFRKGLAHIIQQHSIAFKHIFQADCGHEALSIIKNEKNISVALVDINLPDMNGLVLAKKIMALFPSIIIVIISGYDDFNFTRQAIQLQVFDYLLKPVAPSDITYLLNKIENKRINDASQKRMFKNEEVNLSPLCLNAIDIIKNRYSDNTLSLAFVSKELFVDSSYLSKQLKKQTGKSFSDYLTDYRLNKAKELLQQTTINLSIQEVSTKVGYANPHYFSRLFKLHENLSPTEFKEKHFKNQTVF